ncbi:MAG: hypothetical protein Q8P05_01355 [Candidatus Diapherotrites archaeon]|nr:hypothetical protein [Candidatus Diapherotrites archaeon]MDZ4256317.1 hypothetical protein [archaeon]
MNRVKVCGIIGLGIVIGLIFMGSLVVARQPEGAPQRVWVTNKHDGQSFAMFLLATGRVSRCHDTDGGINPMIFGTLYATNWEGSGTRHLTEYWTSSRRIREFACGKDIFINGIRGDPHLAYAFDFYRFPH